MTNIRVKVKPFSQRRHSRILACQVIYAQGIVPTADESLLFSFSWYDQSKVSKNVANYAIELVQKVQEHLSEIDEQIHLHLNNWDIERLNYVDLAILRMATAELLFCSEVPVNVVINEAVDVAKILATSKSKMLINGVLDSLSHAVRGEEKS